MKRALNKLTDYGAKRFAAQANDPANRGVSARLGDGGGLWLYRTQSGTVSWTFNYSRLNRRTEIGVGRYPDLSLADAREIARQYRNDLAKGLDPLTEKRKRQAAELDATFLDSAISYRDAYAQTWRSAQTLAAFNRAVYVYCKPIHKRPIAELNIADVLSVLTPLTKKPTIFRSTRSLIHRIVDRAVATGKRAENLANPADQKRIAKAQPINHRAKHFDAPDAEDAPSIYRSLIGQLTDATHPHHPTIPLAKSTNRPDRRSLNKRKAQLALALIMLTGVRKNECLRARISEFQHLDDPSKATWTIPAERMKTHRPHIVPLTQPAIAIIRQQITQVQNSLRINDPSSPALLNAYLWPSNRSNPNDPKRQKPLAATAFNHLKLPHTVHGLRSTLTDWLGDETDTEHETREMILAHTIPNATEAAYRRSTAVKKRRVALTLWSQYLTSTPT